MQPGVWLLFESVSVVPLMCLALCSREKQVFLSDFGAGLFPGMNAQVGVVPSAFSKGLTHHSHPVSPVLYPVPETPLDCGVSLWSSWGLCGGPCGKLGAKSRTRYVRVQPANNGTPCPELEEEAECAPDNCV